MMSRKAVIDLWWIFTYIVGIFATIMYIGMITGDFFIRNGMVK